MLQALEDRQNRFPESLSRFFNNLIDLDDDAIKIDAMSSNELRRFMSHGDSHADKQMLDGVSSAMQGIENRLYNLRMFILPKLLEPTEVDPSSERAIYSQAFPDDNDGLPATPSPTPSVSTTEDCCVFSPLPDIAVTIGLSPINSPFIDEVKPHWLTQPMDECPLHCSDVRDISEWQLPNGGSGAVRDVEQNASPMAAAAPTNRVKLPVSNKASDLNRELHIPESLAKILDTVISRIITQRARIVCQEDIIPCYNQLIAGPSGDKIKEFLQAALLPGTEAGACDAFCLLQQRIAPGEQPITTTELRDLQRYLSSQVFNGKKVAFTLEDMSHFLNLKTTPAFLSKLPPSLTRLVNYLIETTLTLRTTEKVALKKRIFLKQLQQCDTGKQALELLSAIAAPDHKIINRFLARTDGVSPLNRSIISRSKVNQLKEYLDEHFLAPWLFAFDTSELNDNDTEATTQAVCGKARWKRKTRRDDYYYDPPYVKRR